MVYMPVHNLRASVYSRLHVSVCPCEGWLLTNNKLSTIEWNVNVWSKERDSGQCVYTYVCMCGSGGRSRWLFMPSHVPGTSQNRDPE